MKDSRWLAPTKSTKAPTALKLKSNFVALLLIFSLPIYAERHYGAQLNLGMIPAGLYEASIHYKLTPTFSLTFPVSYYDARAAVVRLASFGYQPSLGFAPKFHVWGEALDMSIYVEPQVKLGYIVHFPTSSYAGDQAVLIRQALVLGFDWVSTFGLLIDIHCGLENYYLIYTVRPPPDPSRDKSQWLVRPTITAALGYAW